MCSITTDHAGKIPVAIHIQPVVVNLFLDSRHRSGSVLSRSLYSFLTALGFALDWHSPTQSKYSRHYRPVEGVSLDEDLFFDYYGGEGHTEGTRHLFSDLQDVKSRSIQNGQYVHVNGYDVLCVTNTVVSTERSVFVTLHNALEYPVLVHLTEVDASAIPAHMVATNHSEMIEFAPGAVREGLIPSNGHLQLGPILFKPTAIGAFSRYFALMNNYTGLEMLLVAGKAMNQPILLRDATGVVKVAAETACEA